MILTKNVELDNNTLEDSRQASYYERVRVVNLVSYKIVYNVILLIMIYDNNNGFL